MNKDKEKSNTAILHYTAPPVVGGVEAVIQAHCQVFRAFNYPVAVIAGQGNEESLAEGTVYHQIPELNTQHEEVLEINAALEQGNIPDSFEPFTNQLYKALGSILIDFDHLIVHNVFTKHFNIPLTAALFRLIEDGKIRNCIGWCHDFTWTSPNSRSKVHDGYPWDLLRRFNPDIHYVTVSQERQKMLAALLEQPQEAIRVVYNGVNPRVLLGLSREGEALINRLGLLDSEVILLMPVRVTKAKHIEFALDLLVALKAEGISPKLVLTGPPDPHSDTIMAYYRTLQSKREELNLLDEMHFVYESGPDPDQPYEVGMDVVGDIFRISDLMLMPSHREGFGMPVLEAGLVGIPAICTEGVPAAIEIGGEDVIVFDTGEGPANLARKIVQWMEVNPQYRFRRKVRTKFTWKAIFEQEILPLLANRS